MIKPRSEFHRNLLLNPKSKTDNRMITVEQCLLFAEWLAERYTRLADGWVPKYYHPQTKHTTRELWDEYQKFLGAKK